MWTRYKYQNIITHTHTHITLDASHLVQQTKKTYHTAGSIGEKTTIKLS